MANLTNEEQEDASDDDIDMDEYTYLAFATQTLLNAEQKALMLNDVDNLLNIAAAWLEISRRVAHPGPTTKRQSLGFGHRPHPEPESEEEDNDN